MQIAKDAVVTLEYTLRDDAGEVLDQSEGDEPLLYLHGHDQIVPGLERALTDRRAGDQLDVTVAPDDGYGRRDESQVFDLPRSKLPRGAKPEVGMTLGARTPDGHVAPLRIIAVGKDTVTCDGNHPLADQTLHFQVKVKEVRKATAAELEHGHAHGAGGHHH